MDTHEHESRGGIRDHDEASSSALFSFRDSVIQLDNGCDHKIAVVTDARGFDT